jgi:hypothetical protein
VLADKLQEQRAALKGKTVNPRAEVEALVAGDKFDRARAQALVTEKTAAITGKSPEVIAAAGDFYDSLTPAQQTKVREFMQSAAAGAEDEPPRSLTACSSLPPEGAAFGLGAARRPNLSYATISRMQRILLIDDDAQLGEPLATYFRAL